MLTEQLINQSTPTRTPSLLACHPMDSSRLLLAMMSLARKAEMGGRQADGDPLQGIISHSVLTSLLAALRYRDEATLMHSTRVASLCVGMGKQLGWSAEQLTVLHVAGLLHDIGKIGIPDHILHKPGRLTPEETEYISVHYALASNLMQALRINREVIEIVTQSHSYYEGTADGSRALGEGSHQGARILAVADAYESLSSPQVYRDAKTHEETLGILTEASGTKFDGNIVSALERWKAGHRPVASDLSSSDEFRILQATNDIDVSEGTHGAEDASTLCHIFHYLYMLESMYDGFYILDSDLRFAVWSQGTEDLLGLPCREILGQVWTSRLLAYADRQGQPMAEHDSPMHQVIASGRPACKALKVQDAADEWLDVEMQSIPLLDEQGNLQGVAEIFTSLSGSRRNQGQYRELKLAASRDALTGVANRGELEKQLRQLIIDTNARRNADPFSVIFVDIDFFKSINDTHGHGVGDRVLVDFARLLQNETYNGEFVARYGGEEFVIVCPSTDLDRAVERAERLRKTLRKAVIGDGAALQVTASFGVAQFHPKDQLESLLQRADKALYNAKESGRDQTCQLTVAEMEELLAAEEESQQASQESASDKATWKTGRFVHVAEFTACVNEDLKRYKLKGFAAEQDAKVVNVQPEQVVLQIGQTGLIFRGWGSDPKSQPVRMTVQFNELPSVGQRGGARMQIRVTIEPVGTVKDNAVFQLRAKHLLKALRSYFVAD